MSYINYYNGENSLISFEFEGLTKEEGNRIQAYLLQDSTFFIQDKEALKKISEEAIELFKCDDYIEGEIYIKKSPENKDQYILEGYQKHVVGSDEYEFSLFSNIYEGLNFIAFESTKKNIQSPSCVSSSINWMYEKAYDPTKLVRFAIKNRPIGRLEPTYERIEYETVDGFNIKKDPTEVFNKNKKEAKVKKI